MSTAYTPPVPRSNRPVLRYARLTRSQIKTKQLSHAGRVLLEVICFHWKPDQEKAVSQQQLARWADLSEGSVSRLMPELAAEPGATNRVPFIRRRWCPQQRCYFITRLAAPEERGWFYDRPAPACPPAEQHDPPVPAGQSAAEPAANAIGTAAQLSFLDLAGSTVDPAWQAAMQPIVTPQTGSESGSIADPPVLFMHESNKLLAQPSSSSSPSTAQPADDPAPGQPAPQPAIQTRPPSPAAVPCGELDAYLRRRHIGQALRLRLYQACPTLTLERFQEQERIAAARPIVRHPAVLAAKVLADGEALARPDGPAAPAEAPVDNLPIYLTPGVPPHEKRVWSERLATARGNAAKRAVLAAFARLYGPPLPVSSAARSA